MIYYPAPVIAAGAYPNEEGHVWVIDGYFEYKCSIVDNPHKKLPNELFLHCIWGFSSLSSNGYYFYNTDTGILDDTSIGPNNSSVPSPIQILIYGKIRVPGVTMP
ncbi:MAG: hypothetical protein HDR80_07310 [Bacteroides sp.]|nr:hypothetical protein [Bacteroides sp.]